MAPSNTSFAAFDQTVSPQSPKLGKMFIHVTLKEIYPEYSLEGLMLKLKLHYFGHPMQVQTHWKMPMLGKIEGKEGAAEDEIV